MSPSTARSPATLLPAASQTLAQRPPPPGGAKYQMGAEVTHQAWLPCCPGGPAQPHFAPPRVWLTDATSSGFLGGGRRLISGRQLSKGTSHKASCPRYSKFKDEPARGDSSPGVMERLCLSPGGEMGLATCSCLSLGWTQSWSLSWVPTCEATRSPVRSELVYHSWPSLCAPVELRVLDTKMGVVLGRKEPHTLGSLGTHLVAFLD